MDNHVLYAVGAVFVCLVLVGFLVKKFQKSSQTPVADTFDHDNDYGEVEGEDNGGWTGWSGEVKQRGQAKITDAVDGVSVYGAGENSPVPKSALKPMYEGSSPTNIGKVDVLNAKKSVKKTVRKTSNRKSGTKKKTSKK